MPESVSEGQSVWSDDEERARLGRVAYENEQLERYAMPVRSVVDWREVYEVDQGDLWVFFDGDHPRDRVTTLGLIRMFTGLGLEPSGYLKADVFVGMYDRLVALEQELRSSRLSL